MPDTEKEFAELLLDARTELGYTQERMAKALGIGIRSYSNYERGETQPLPAKRIFLVEQIGLLANGTVKELDVEDWVPIHYVVPFGPHGQVLEDIGPVASVSPLMIGVETISPSSHLTLMTARTRNADIWIPGDVMICTPVEDEPLLDRAWYVFTGPNGIAIRRLTLSAAEVHLDVSERDEKERATFSMEDFKKLFKLQYRVLAIVRPI